MDSPRLRRQRARWDIGQMPHFVLWGGAKIRALDDNGRLDSWKAIAAYLQRDVRTVRRWEASEQLPVHRHHHNKLASVYALKSELDAWRASREPAAAEPRG